MTVIVLVTAVVIIAASVAAGLGRGGEMARHVSAAAAFDPPIGTAADVAMVRPPMTLLGYHPGATSTTLNRIAATVTERDVEIEMLRHRLAELERQAQRADPPLAPPAWRPDPDPGPDPGPGDAAGAAATEPVRGDRVPVRGRSRRRAPRGGQPW